MTERKKKKSSDSICQEKPWSKNENNIWLASTLSLYRNIEKFKFPTKLDNDQQKQIIALLSKDLLKMKSLKKPRLLKADEMQPYEKEYLVEHFLTPQSFQQAHSGEAFIVDDTGEFLVSLNINNHIQMELVECKGELESAWNRLVTIETQLGKNFNYAYSQKFGFLTANPHHCGTGLVATVFLQPSALVHTEQLEEVLKRDADETLTITGLQGSPDEIIGDVLAVQNSYTLGVSEENIVSALRTFTTKMMVEENSARNHLRQEESALVKDKVSRAFGLLIHSYQIDAIEALDALSLIKLGGDLGWVKGITPKKMNELLFRCRRAHLICDEGKMLEHEELLHKRAEFIHKALSKVSLTI